VRVCHVALMACAAPAFKVAFRAGAVLGFALCGLALLMLFGLIMFVAAVKPSDYGFPGWNGDAVNDGVTAGGELVTGGKTR
jgi:Na+/H+-translocating membrane pyrophosphatase